MRRDRTIETNTTINTPALTTNTSPLRRDQPRPIQPTIHKHHPRHRNTATTHGLPQSPQIPIHLNPMTSRDQRLPQHRALNTTQQNQIIHERRLLPKRQHTPIHPEQRTITNTTSITQLGR